MKILNAILFGLFPTLAFGAINVGENNGYWSSPNTWRHENLFDGQGISIVSATVKIDTIERFGSSRLTIGGSKEGHLVVECGSDAQFREIRVAGGYCRPCSIAGGEGCLEIRSGFIEANKCILSPGDLGETPSASTLIVSGGTLILSDLELNDGTHESNTYHVEVSGHGVIKTGGISRRHEPLDGRFVIKEFGKIIVKGNKVEDPTLGGIISVPDGNNLALTAKFSNGHTHIFLRETNRALADIRYTTDDSIAICVSTENGKQYRLMRSSDLLTWEPNSEWIDGDGTHLQWRVEDTDMGFWQIESLNEN